MTSAAVYFLFALSAGNLPSFTALSVYPDQATCTKALETTQPVLANDEGGVHLMCLSSEAIEALAKTAGV